MKKALTATDSVVMQLRRRQHKTAILSTGQDDLITVRRTANCVRRVVVAKSGLTGSLGRMRAMLAE